MGFILVGIVIYATRGAVFFEAVFTKDFTVGFAYILITMAMIGWLFAAILLAVDLDQKLEKRRHKKTDGNPQPATTTAEENVAGP